ncbi:glycosyltransferase family 2 protein [Desulfocurvus sp. DL9XJH121]
MNTPKISVYITSHNYAAYLSEAIESVLRQSMDSWELLLIDNGSTDETAHIMELYAGDPRIRLIRTEKMRLAAVANLALREARGEYIVRLDADDIFEENILLVLSSHLDRRPEVALVFPDYYLMDEYGQVYAQERREQYHYKNHIQDIPPHGACTMMRRSVILEVGGYNENIKAQDGYYIWSKVNKTHKCENINLPLFYYRQHSKNLTKDSGRILDARRKIKNTFSEAEIQKNGPIISVIPCRRYYDALPDLWSQKFKGKTLLANCIEKSLASDLFEYVIVTSDTPEVCSIISHYDDKRLRFIPRTQKQTLRTVPLTMTLETVLDGLGLREEGLTQLSYLQAPLTTTATLEEGIHTLVLNQADSSFTAEEIQAPVFMRTPYGLSQINGPKHFTSDFNIVYSETKVVLTARNANIRRGELLGPRSVHYVIPKEESFFILTKKDLAIANFLASEAPHGKALHKARPDQDAHAISLRTA